METYCLIIDDDEQEGYFNTNIKNVLKKENIAIIPNFIHTKDDKYINEDGETLCYQKIVDDCISVMHDFNVSIIACDYGIGTSKDLFNGIDLLADLAEEKPKTHRILYSGTITKAIKDVKDKSENDIEKRLMKLSKIHEFNSGKGYAEKVIKFLKNPEIQFRQYYLQNMKKYHDLSFQSCYPAFKGKNFKEIANEIENGTVQGKDFQQALISQTIAYLVEINKDDE